MMRAPRRWQAGYVVTTLVTFSYRKYSMIMSPHFAAKTPDQPTRGGFARLEHARFLRLVRNSEPSSAKTSQLLS